MKIFKLCTITIFCALLFGCKNSNDNSQIWYSVNYDAKIYGFETVETKLIVTVSQQKNSVQFFQGEHGSYTLEVIPNHNIVIKNNCKNIHIGQECSVLLSLKAFAKQNETLNWQVKLPDGISKSYSTLIEKSLLSLSVPDQATLPTNKNNVISIKNNSKTTVYFDKSYFVDASGNQIPTVLISKNTCLNELMSGATCDLLILSPNNIYGYLKLNLQNQALSVITFSDIVVNGVKTQDTLVHSTKEQNFTYDRVTNEVQTHIKADLQNQALSVITFSDIVVNGAKTQDMLVNATKERRKYSFYFFTYDQVTDEVQTHITAITNAINDINKYNSLNLKEFIINQKQKDILKNIGKHLSKETWLTLYVLLYLKNNIQGDFLKEIIFLRLVDHYPDNLNTIPNEINELIQLELIKESDLSFMGKYMEKFKKPEIAFKEDVKLFEKVRNNENLKSTSRIINYKNSIYSISGQINPIKEQDLAIEDQQKFFNNFFDHHSIIMQLEEVNKLEQQNKGGKNVYSTASLHGVNTLLSIPMIKEIAFSIVFPDFIKNTKDIKDIQRSKFKI